MASNGLIHRAFETGVDSELSTFENCLAWETEKKKWKKKVFCSSFCMCVCLAVSTFRKKCQAKQNK